MSSLTSSLVGAPLDPSNEDSLHVKVTGENLVSYKFKVGPSDSTKCNDSANYSENISIDTPISNSLKSFTDGKLTLCVLGIRSSGKIQNLDSPSFVEWTRDTSIPTVTLSASSTFINLSNKHNFSISGNCSENTQPITISASNDSASSVKINTTSTCTSGLWTYSMDLASLADGMITITADHADAAGNKSNSSQLKLNKDTIAPTVTFNSPLPTIDNSNKSSYLLGGTCSENGQLVKLSGALSKSITCSSNLWRTTLNISSLLDGSIDFYTDLNDTAGNSAPQAHTTLTKDTSKFMAALSNVPDLYSNLTTLNVSITGSDVVSYKYKLGSASSTDCSSSASYSSIISISTNITDNLLGFSDGPLKLCVLGINSVGTSQPLTNPTSFTWTKDSTPPGSFTISGVSGSSDSLVDGFLTSTGKPTVTWSSSTGVDSYDVTIYENDGITIKCPLLTIYGDTSAAISTCTTLTNLINYKIKITAKDLANNSSTASYTFKVNKTASSTKSSISGTSLVTADGSSASTITITLKNSDNVALEGLTPTFSATDTGSTNTYIGCSASNNLGVSTCYLKSTKAESKTISITSPFSLTSTSPVIFIAGNPTQLSYTIQPSNTFAGSAINPAIIVQLLDTFYNPVKMPNKSISLSFNSFAPGATLSGTLTQLTNSNGEATFNDIIIDKTYSGYSLQATTPIILSYTKVSNNFDITADTLSKLIFSMQPSTAKAGDVILPAIKVEIQDSNNNVISSASNNITITIQNNPGGSILSGTTSINAINGVATFTDLSLNKTGVNYTLSAQSGGLNITSDNFNITPGTPSKLVFSAQPQDLYAGIGSGSDVKVAVVDINDNLVTSASNTISLSISTNPGGALLNGGASISSTASSGIATFSNLSLDKAANDYILSASSGALTGTSNKFKVISLPLSWGDNALGQIGNNTSGGISTSPLVTSTLNGIDPLYLSFKVVSAGSFHSCGITYLGETFCWGDNSSGQIGYGSIASSFITTPKLIFGSFSFIQISAGGEHTCALDSDGNAYCWGANLNGQLGTGNNDNTSSPQLVTGGYKFSTISSGGHHTCGITLSTNQVYCWGYNMYGQLGNGNSGSSADLNLPTLLSSSLTFSSVAAGNGHTCAIESTGKIIYCWGHNDVGQIGNNNLVDQPIPVQIFGSTSYKQVTLGNSFTCGITTSDSGYCWGKNDFGQLGDSTTTSNKKPSAINGGYSFLQISAGATHACALTLSNQPFCWGDNSYGQLGIGTNTPNYSIPQPMVKPTGWQPANMSLKQISAGGRHTIGLFGTP